MSTLVKQTKLDFDGNGTDLFILYLKNMFLTFVTFGIYSFWAEVNIKRFLYKHTTFGDERFGYHATGKERFLGYLKAVGILILAYLCIIAVVFTMIFIFGPDVGFILSTIIVYGAIFYFIPVIIVGQRRFALSRTSWKGIRFRFTGNPKDLRKTYIKGIIFTVLSLGFYYPWFHVNLRKFLISNSNLGTEAFSYEADGKEMFFLMLKGILLSILTLGIYSFWYMSDLLNYEWKKTKVQNSFFQGSFKGVEFLKTTIFALLVSVLTLGFGLPWALIMFMKLFTSSIKYNNELDLEFIKSSNDLEASALSDGVADAADALFS